MYKISKILQKKSFMVFYFFLIITFKNKNVGYSHLAIRNCTNYFLLYLSIKYHNFSLARFIGVL